MKNCIFSLLLLLICDITTAKESQLCILENTGQVRDQNNNARPDIDFVVHSDNVNLFIGSGQLHYQFIGTANQNINTYRLDVTLLDANPNATLTTEHPHTYSETHFLPGIKRTTAHSFKKLTYHNIYPNIDWVIYVKDNKAEYEFIINEGGRVADIRFQYAGAKSLTINTDGSFTAATPLGSITETAPVSFEASGKNIPTSFRLDENILTFVTAAYHKKLIIDPAVVWGTYYGGTLVDEVYAMTQDNSGNIILCGRTMSANDIATVGSHLQSIPASITGFLVKFDTAGTRLWGTYFGGNVGETVQDVAVDASGNIYAVGDAGSNNGIATLGAHQQTLNSTQDGFLAKFTSGGIHLWGTYFGGDTTDAIHSVTTDNNGNVFISGYTQSTSSISTLGSFQPNLSGFTDGFLARFNTNGALQWSTYYGGSLGDFVNDICTDNNGHLYICGSTGSSSGIATVGCHQPINAGGDNFLVKFTDQGQRIWGTYYGGSSTEQAASIAYDGYGHVYLGGHTSSDTGIATPGSHQPALNLVQSTDAFLVQFNENGVRQWGTYYGHWGADGMSGPNGGGGIACDNAGNVFFSGMAASDSFITTSCVPKEFKTIGTDAFLVKMDSNGVRQWGTYYGGTGSEGTAQCTWFNGSIYLAGNTTSTNGIATPGSHDETYAGNPGDGYLVRIVDCEIPGQPPLIIGDTSVCEGDTVMYYVTPLCQATSYTWSLPAGWSGSSTTDTISVTAGATNGIITVSPVSGCGVGTSQSLPVTVHPTPVPVVTQNGNLLTTGLYLAYQWNLYGAPVTGATNQQYLAPNGGHYTVTVTDTNGCSGTSAVLPLSTEMLSNNKSIAIYPNPTNGDFTLLTNGLQDKEIKLSISNITGQEVFDTKIPSQPSYMLRLKEKLSPGIYILHISAGNYQDYIKLTVQ